MHTIFRLDSDVSAICLFSAYQSSEPFVFLTTDFCLHSYSINKLFVVHGLSLSKQLCQSFDRSNNKS